MTFKNNFSKFIVENNLFSKDDKIVLAMSSGLDSVVLVRLFYDLKINFAIAHCNFQLRGKDSELDEKFAKNLAKKYNVPFYSIQFETKKIAKENKKSIQEIARNLRYQWFEDLRAEIKFDKIATAHHLSDSIETFFINSSRGTGLSGLKGIPVKNNHIIRPLLFASREEIADYARQKKLKWREDISNEGDDYLRNRIRHHVIPVFKKENPSFETGMASTLAMFKFADEIQKTFLENWKKKHVKKANEGTIIIPLKTIDQFGFPVELLSALLHSYGITNLDAKKIMASSSGKIFKSRNYNLLYDRGNLLLRSLHLSENPPILLSSFPDTLSIGTNSFHFKLINVSKLEEIPKSESVHVLDAGLLKLPLTIRPWKAGDIFSPLGMTQKKKVSDFLIDKKINLFEKEMVHVLLSNSDIVCILGHRIDNRYKITEDTTTVLHIEKIYG